MSSTVYFSRTALCLLLPLAACGAQTSSTTPARPVSSAATDDSQVTDNTELLPEDSEPASGDDTAADEATELNSEQRAFASRFVWTKTPSLSKLPPQGAVAAIGQDVFLLSDIKISVKKSSGEWTFKAKGGPDNELGPSITVKGSPKPNTYSVRFGENDGLFQAPSSGKSLRDVKGFDDTTSVNGDNAYVLQIENISIEGNSGTASGKFVVVYDSPRMWAAGSFVDAPVSAY